MIKQAKLIFSIATIVLVIASCRKETKTATTTNTTDTSTDVEDGVSHEESSDYTWDVSSEDVINLNSTSISTTSTKVTISGTTATINAAGNFRVNGSLTNGKIIVDAASTDLVRVILNGITLTNTSGTALYVKKSKKTIINLVSGTTSTITDGSTYTDTTGGQNAAIYAKCPYSIFGSGTLKVNANYEDGISGKDGLVIASGTYNVTAKDDGIRGKDFLIIHDGAFTINSVGDALKSDNDANTNVGYVTIDAGTYNITATQGDGIAAQTNLTLKGGNYTITTGGGSSVTPSSTVSTKALKGDGKIEIAGGTYTLNSSDDGLNSNKGVSISGGTISLGTADDGIHADSSITISGGNVTITKAYEGIESPIINVSGGVVNVTASNDGFNATYGTVSGGTESNDGSQLNISGGIVIAAASDAIDSNGNITITGGTVIVCGPTSQPEEGIDFNGTFNMNGGYLISAGSNASMTKAMSTTSTQVSLYLKSSASLAATSLFHIENASGTEVVTFKPKNAVYYFHFSSSSLAKNTAYKVYFGGSYTGGSYTGNSSGWGLYTGGTYSTTGATLKSTVTTSSTSTVTTATF